jgi:hypothetical protein
MSLDKQPERVSVPGDGVSACLHLRAEATHPGRLQIGTVAAFKSEWVAAFKSEYPAGFIGIRRLRE